MSTAGDRNAERVSLLGPKSDLKGDFVTDEELVVLGRVSGQRIQAPTITIGPGARVTADVYGKKVRIEGVVVGDIYAEGSVTVQSSARIRGTIHAPSITILEGAEINGGANIQVGKTEAARDSGERVPRARAARRA
jgi:cytoskeletal protein CcmA (bactofilin family)